MTSARARRHAWAMLALTTLVAASGAPVSAQQGPRSRLCFGVSFDRGCALMLQFEAGYRVAAAGTAPRLDRAPFRARSDHSQAFLGAGLMFASSPTTTLGAIYEAGTGDDRGTRAVGIRWGRQLRAENRLDLTAGAVFLPLTGDSVVPSHQRASQGAFAEVALHGSNLLTLVVRDEAYASHDDARGGNLVFAGVRAESTPAAILTLVSAALIGLAAAGTGARW